MPATGRASGTPASISASEAPHTVAIEDEPFELGDLRDDADRVGERFLRRQQRAHRAPGELAVADLAPAGRAHAAGLAGRVGREVVVQHEVLAVLAFQRVDDLLVLAGAEGGDRQRLGLAAGEQRRAVRARQHADLARDRAHRLGVAAVDALAGRQDGAAHDVALEVLEHACRPGRSWPGRRRTIATLAFFFTASILSLRACLALLGIGAAQLVAANACSVAPHRLLLPGCSSGSGHGSLAQCSASSMIASMTGWNAWWPKLHGAEHDVLGQLLGLGFDHQHAFGGAGDDEVELRVRHLVELSGSARIAPSM